MMAVSDTSFSELVRVNVLEPAGMTRSARINRDLPLRSDLAARLAPPHRVDSTGAIVRAPAPPPQGDGAAGGVISTVLDLAKFDVALDSGALISAESRKAMMTPTRSEGGVPVPYGIGWFVQEHLDHTMVWHSGWWEEAYSALYLKIPDLQLTFIVLANSEGIWWGNPLDDAAVQRSEFAQAFFEAFVEN
jgi:CubicO group peptidase (beta-lactamase class C family)